MHLLHVLRVQDVIWWTLSRLEPWIQGSRLRKAALEEVMRLIHYEVPSLHASAMHCATPKASVGSSQSASIYIHTEGTSVLRNHQVMVD